MVTSSVAHHEQWQLKLLAFYNYTEGGITANVPDLSLNNLGDLLDQNNYQIASSIYSIPESNLQQAKQLYADAFYYWYYNIWQSGDPSIAISAKKEKQTNKESKLILDNCSDILNACKSEANANYFFRIGECYAAAIGVGTFGTPVLGGFFAIGCGLYVGRVRKNSIIGCNAEFEICRGLH